MKSKTLMFVTEMTLLATLAVPVRLAAQEQQNKKLPHYTVTDLGSLGGTFSEAVGVNNRGSVAGSSLLPGDAVVHAFFWRKGVTTDLGTLGGPNSVAPEVGPPNNRGEVAGFSDTLTLDPNAENCFGGFFGGNPTPYTCLPFVWRDGMMTALPTLGGNNGIAAAINHRGQVAGLAETPTPDPTCAPPLVLQFEPVIWEKGQISMRLPTVSGDPDGIADGINDNGQAVGWTGPCFPVHAVLWQNGKATDLGSLGGAVFNIAFAINNRGQVAGESDLPGDTTHHAFLWTKDDGMQDLGTLPGDDVSIALSINNKTQVVGVSFDASGNKHPYLWKNGVMMNLNTLIPANSPLFLLEALGINDRGQIVGYGQLSNGDVHAFLLTKCEEHHGDSEDCEEGGGENTVLQTSPAPYAEPSGTLHPSLLRKMNRYRFPGPAFGPRN
jgi:probable HAF family extracellular repeat protein